MSENLPNQVGSQELSEELKTLDESVGSALRGAVQHETDSALVERIVRASAQDLPAPHLQFEPVRSGAWASGQLRAAAVLLLVSGVALAAWFALHVESRPVVEEPTPVLAVEFQDQLGVASAEEVMLVAILDGDGAWIEQESLNRPAAVEAEPVLRTRGTNVDDLAEEINQILGTTS